MNPCSDGIAKPANKGKLPKTKCGSGGREGALPRKLHCINEQHHFWKWRGNTESHLSAQDRERRGERERERDGTQHWLPNYAFYHFSHNRVPPFFSCPVYSCSCSSAALMRKIKNNHTMLYLHLQPPNYFLLQHHIHTQSQSCEGHMCTAASFIFLFLFNVTM